MKHRIKIAAIATLMTVPVLSLAAQPVTRAQLRAEFVALEQAGYKSGDWDYPASIQRAEAVVSQRNAGLTAHGATVQGSAQAGKGDVQGAR